MFDPFVSHLAPYRPHLLSILRIVTALLFLEHATVKLFGFPATEMPAPAALTFFWWIGVLELVGSVLLVVGWWTRLAAFILSGEMAVAYSWRMRRTASFRSRTAARRRSCSALSSCT